MALNPAAADPAALRLARELAAATGARLVRFDFTAGGLPAIEIVSAAERAAADLVVLAREPRDTVEGTVRRARVPCLVVPPGPVEFHRILAAVDDGPDATEVVSAATRLGRLTRGQVTILHVEAPGLVPAGHAVEHPAWAGASRDWLVRRGEPVTEILRAVREDGIDLLVHGHHRGGPRNGHETGSIAARLLGRAPCAVMTVPI